MASLPWTQFPVAATISNADIVALVQAGVNVQSTRAMLLKAFTSETVALRGTSAGEIGVSDVGDVTIQSASGKTIVITANPGALTFTALIMGFQSGPGGSIDILTDGGCEIFLDDSSVEIFVAPGGTIHVDLPGLKLTNFAGGCFELVDYCNRVADAVVALRLGIPIV